MGQNQHKSKYNDYRNSSSSLPKRTNDKDNDDDIKENDKKENSPDFQKIHDELNNMNISLSEVQENYKWYKYNYSNLLKINKIISNIKFANLYHLTPEEVLSKLLESEVNNYALPQTWEELFKLEISIIAVDKLYIQSEIERVIKKYADRLNINSEKLKNIINQDNYEEYDKDFERKIKNIKINEEKEEEKEEEEKEEKQDKENEEKKNEEKEKDGENFIVNEIKALEYFEIDEQEIKDNIDYYTKNIGELSKINNIIDNAKRGRIYNITPERVLRKFYLNNPNHFDFPEKWEELFNLKCPKDQTELLFEATIKQLNSIGYYEDYENFSYEAMKMSAAKELKEKKVTISDIKELKYLKVKEKEINNNLNYYIKNFEQLKKIDIAIENAKKGKFYNSKPEKIYKKIFPSSALILPEKWEDLFTLKFEKFEIHLIYVSTEIEKLKFNYSNFDQY